MFCQNCGTEIAGGAKFCPNCGFRTGERPGTTDEGSAEPGERQGAAVEVSTIPQLKDHLLALRDAKDTDSALTYAVEAQLQVLDVLNSPAMTSSCFDLMIESLHKALQRTQDEHQRTALQDRAAIMAKNMVFFMEAKLRYEENKHSEQGKVLLKKGCSLLAESAQEIMLGGVSGGISTVVKITSGKLFDNLMQDDGFFSMLFDFIGKKERLKKNNEEFDTFLMNFIGKLDRYKAVFGKSILLSELVHQYKDRLIAKQRFTEPEPPCGIMYRPGIWIKSFVLILVLVGFSLIPIEIGLYSEKTWQGIVPLGAAGLWVVVNLIYFLICVFSWAAEKSAYGKALQAYDKQSGALEQYYTAIANDYNVLGTDAPGNNSFNPDDIRSFQAALQHYERVHTARVSRKSGGKSWVSLMLLCVFLGWMGAHRFYAGKIGTGILMLVTLPSGISFIWAIIDLVSIFSGKFTDKSGRAIQLAS
jgi:TM2 domain-containing membrane protein YozV